jgi:hypothetical protein
MLTIIVFKAIDSSARCMKQSQRVDQEDRMISGGKITTCGIQTTQAARKRNIRYPRAKGSILTLRVACWTV